jgi:non-specific serine/threonine protein kinase
LDPAEERKRKAREGGRPTVTASRNVPGRIGPYRVECELGRGGMGVVYLGRDPRLDRPVAIKVLPSEFTSDERRSRFEREARTAAQLSHPNIATIYELGQSEQTYFIAMEFIEGKTLHDVLLRPDPLPASQAVDLGTQIAEGLAAAHSRKIVHRDLKPQNVMLTPEGRVKILDFGLAKITETVTHTQTAERSLGTSATALTKEQRVLGTAGYMSPEQVRGQQVDSRSDLFTFGIVLYEMLTGEVPFHGESGADIFTAILRDSPKPVSELNPELPTELDRVISRCLDKNRSSRYQSANQVLEDLRRAGRQLSAGPAKEVPSVAVLPFANMSADPENEYFTDGVAEEIINALSTVKSLRVASRTSSFAFKDRHEDICRIGEQLRVRTVLEGSVRKVGNRLRVTAQLVNVADGYQLWSERYDRDVEDVFAIQDEIAQKITEALEIVLTEKEKQAIEKAPTANVKAYDYYLRGRQHIHEFRRKGDEEYARAMFKKAIDLDSDYALAHAGVANCSSMLYLFYDASDENLREADVASCKALELDSELAEAHISRGLAVSLAGNYYNAHKEFDTAIRLNPKLFDAYYFYGRICHSQGRMSEAAQLFEKACKLNPESYYPQTFLAQAYAGLGRQGDSEATRRRGLKLIEKHLEAHPDDTRAICHGATAWSQLGDRELALEWAERARRMDPEEPTVLYNIGCTYAVLGDKESAIDLLEQSAAHGFRHREWFENDPDLESLHDHPRFQTLLESR